ncbi:uncharacterized protein B0H18DRAFT_956299 [Fomitopsis serialis]|uniref:uncharacterized protein n=1 Tax=Fomitopsis serialis TaxID=139415 RepID=UPI002008C145|nr:uncharacterized protein B0H18DRAFT_956299 [Neoantrodia serialis]KAH9922419.1 hypothetical protein B0H18DRAFT_956299 [Neoantrodia serialis]
MEYSHGKDKAQGAPGGTFPSVYFGMGDLSVYTLTRTTEEVLSNRIPGGLATPFRTHNASESLKDKIRIRVHWPNHDDDSTHVAQNFSLRTGHITVVQLAQSVSSVVKRVMEHCMLERNRPPNHCCWGVNELKQYGLTGECVYLFALHHVGGMTFQPELHVAPSMQPHLFPSPRPATYEDLVAAGLA